MGTEFVSATLLLGGRRVGRRAITWWCKADMAGDDEDEGELGSTPFYLMAPSAATDRPCDQSVSQSSGTQVSIWRRREGGSALECHHADSCHPSQWDLGNIYLSPLVKSFMRAHPETETCWPARTIPFHSRLRLRRHRLIYGP